MFYLTTINKWLLSLLAFLLSIGWLNSQPMEWMPEIKQSKSWEFTEQNAQLSADNYIQEILQSLPAGFHFEKLNEFNYQQQQHIFYQQYYQGIQIEDAQVNLHLENGKVYSHNGEFAKQISMSIGANDLDNSRLAKIALATADADATLNKKLTGKKIFVKHGNGEYKLAQRFLMNTANEGSKYLLDLNMKDGKILNSHYHEAGCSFHGEKSTQAKSTQAIQYQEENALHNTTQLMVSSCAYPVGNTRHYGQRVGEVPHEYDAQFSVYRLEDNCRNIKTVDLINYQATNSQDNTWFAPVEIDAYSAHWAAKVTHDFFSNQLGRNGHFGNGDLLKVNMNSFEPTFQASLWTSPWNSFSINVTNDEFVSLESLGHEYAHGVFWASKWTPGFVPPSLWLVSESRSITEGLCNIMGNEVEAWASGSSLVQYHPKINEDFKVDANENGDSEYDFNFGGSTINSIYYKGIRWNPSEGWSQNQNMYRRSHVLGHLFYLLANPVEDSNYTNAHNPNPVTIHIKPLNGGNSRHETTLLFYLTAMSYISSNWTYKDFAFGLLDQAAKIYGLCSEQTKNVHRALYAVGLTEGPFEIDACGISLTSGNRIYQTPHNLALGESCSLTYYTGAAAETITFRAGNHIIEGDHLFYGEGLIVFEDAICQPGSGVPMLAQEPEYTIDHLRSTPVSMDQLTSFSIFPNPFENRFSLEMDIPEIANISIQIINTGGQMILNKSYSKLQGRMKEAFDLSNYPKGVYFIRMNTGQQVITQKIMHQ